LDHKLMILSENHLIRLMQLHSIMEHKLQTKILKKKSLKHLLKTKTKIL